jgi:preprotein translocase YajC subunit
MNFLFGLVPLQAQPEGSPFGAFVPIILITAIFYLLLIRPQQKKQKQLEAMIKAIDKGDNVVTSGGLHGKVIGVTDDSSMWTRRARGATNHEFALARDLGHRDRSALRLLRDRECRL